MFIALIGKDRIHTDRELGIQKFGRMNKKEILVSIQNEEEEKEENRREEAGSKEEKISVNMFKVWQDHIMF